MAFSENVAASLPVNMRLTGSPNEERAFIAMARCTFSILRKVSVKSLQ